MSYGIHHGTFAIIPQGMKTKVLEKNRTRYIYDKSTMIMDDNCRANGSTLEGRQKGSAYLIGTSYKPPIIISELERIIFIPTHSSRNKECIWLNLNAILNYEELSKNKVEVKFLNHKSIIIDMSYNKFDKQLLRATRLERILSSKKST